MNKKKSVRISLFHLIAFLFIYIGDILLFLAFRGYLFLVMGILFTVSVPLSFCMAWLLTEHVHGKIISELPLSGKSIRQDEQTRITFSMTNNSWLCALNSTWLLTIGNSFYGTSDQQKLLLSVPPHETKQFQITITVTDLGQIIFACREYFITDLLGIFMIHTGCSIENAFFVLPRSADTPNTKLPDSYAGVAELSESRQKGSDHTEVNDIRAYIPGDRPRDIHWKLSARQDGLMVKERISLSGNEHVLLLDLPSKKQDAEKLLTEGYQKVKGLLDNHMAVRILVWNDSLHTFASYSCTNADELEAAYCDIFLTDLSSHNSGLILQYMKNCYPQLESYLYLTQQDDSIELEMYING